MEGGGFENLEIKGAPFQVRPPNFSRGGWTLIKEMHSPGFEKYHILKFFACGSLLFAYLMTQFSKIFHLQRAYNQLLVIILVNNFSNVKNNISLDDET